MSVKIDLRSYYEDLFEALFSFDDEKIRNHLRAYDIEFNDEDDNLWHSVCELLMDLPNTPDDVKELARQWLVQHGYRKVRGRGK